ncbi:MAG TPA: hypothetical protein VIN08_21595 [Ohtaekwangia sp.]|uniref:hypothetical protein n=1 Tax=Ohtaekwangia sp. TaxID=2066019 RepID=UPI002F94FF4F
MNVSRLYIFCSIAIASLIMGFDNKPESLEGTWIRKGDNLKIEIDNEHASIVQEGNKKFPCDIADLYIYKDIQKVKDNLWKCNFLVVTMGSCNTNYEAGEMFIDREGSLVIICPGFASKVYTKAKPRYGTL